MKYFGIKILFPYGAILSEVSFPSTRHVANVLWAHKLSRISGVKLILLNWNYYVTIGGLLFFDLWNNNWSYNLGLSPYIAISKGHGLKTTKTFVKSSRDWRERRSIPYSFLKDGDVWLIWTNIYYKVICCSNVTYNITLCRVTVTKNLGKIVEINRICELWIMNEFFVCIGKTPLLISYAQWIFIILLW